ncbi:MAG: prolyl oligopeptidase family serine peptidase [Alphaproteobacteria bacterium]|nr:prolyl oligopeptidase family serine peptidase [Alphaproteobacteria bacterium]
MKLVAALTMVLTMTGTANADRLTVERVFADPAISGPVARGVKLSPDGKSVTWIQPRPDNQHVTDLWVADLPDGKPHKLIDAASLMSNDRALSEEEKSRRERQGVQSSGVIDYQWDEEGRFILVPVEGDLWLYQRSDAKVSQLTNSKADEIDAKVSPKGGFVSFVRNDNLVVLPLKGGAEKALTADGTELKSWATAEFIAQEEMDRLTGYWWSPDDTRIALTHVDQSGVDVVPRPDINATGAVVVNQRYPRVGRPNAVVDLYVEDVATGRRVKVDLGPTTDIYLARVAWARDGSALYVQRESRDQKRLDLLRVDPATGRSKVIISQTSPHWIELSSDFRPLKDGTLLWSSEESGYRHIYLYGGDGKPIRQVTSGHWPVDAIVGVDEASETVYFGASMDTPLERRIYSVSYRSPATPVAITSAGGWWSGEVSGTSHVLLGTYQDPSTPPRTGIFRPDGTVARWIEENRLQPGHPYYPYVTRLRLPTYGTMKASDGKVMHWMMRTPPDFDLKKKYPVIVQVYGGPASALVAKKWMSPADQLYLEAGYILFSLDNRGTPNRSVAFKTSIDRRMGQLEAEDQLAGAAYLKTLPYVDGARIGITGWSNGGFMTLLALTTPDSPFAAGVAGAPPTDFRLYDTHYTERFMGTDETNHAGYEAADIDNRLDNLRLGSLMLIHGMADDNVTFDNSTRLVAALQARDVGFEMMLYPGLRHRAGWGPAQLRHRTEAALDFFQRKLKPAAAP